MTRSGAARWVTALHTTWLDSLLLLRGQLRCQTGGPCRQKPFPLVSSTFFPLWTACSSGIGPLPLHEFRQWMRVCGAAAASEIQRVSLGVRAHTPGGLERAHFPEAGAPCCSGPERFDPGSIGGIGTLGLGTRR